MKCVQAIAILETSHAQAAAESCIKLITTFNLLLLALKQIPNDLHIVILTTATMECSKSPTEKKEAKQRKMKKRHCLACKFSCRTSKENDVSHIDNRCFFQTICCPFFSCSKFCSKKKYNACLNTQSCTCSTRSRSFASRSAAILKIAPNSCSKLLFDYRVEEIERQRR